MNKRQFVAMLAASAAWILGVAEGSVISGAYHNYEASLDTNGNTSWEDLGTATGGNLRPFSFHDISRVAVSASDPITGKPYFFTNAYDFPGTGTGSGTQTAGNQETSATTFGTSGSTQTATFEIWFKLDTLPVEGKQVVLFETGGDSRGFSFTVSTSSGISRLFANGISPEADASYLLQPGDVGKYLQATAVLGPSTLALYVNGGSNLSMFNSSVAVSPQIDWFGGDGAAWRLPGRECPTRWS